MSSTLEKRHTARRATSAVDRKPWMFDSDDGKDFVFLTRSDVTAVSDDGHFEPLMPGSSSRV
jgi:hypothetical protein